MQYVKLLRPKNWIKNFLLFIPLFFSLTQEDLQKLLTFDNILIRLLNMFVVPFVIMCLLASSVYVLNDIKDVEEDKKDAKKCKRPIASGKVSINQALFLFGVCIITSFSLGIVLTHNAYLLVVMLAYLILNIGYTFKFKHTPVLDIIILSMFYLLRLYFSSAYYNISISIYLYLVTLSASLYFGVCKRLNETSDVRKVMTMYNQSYLDNLAIMFAGLTIVFYGFWVVFYQGCINSQILEFSIIVVIFILMLYHYIVKFKKLSNPTDIVLSNKSLLLSVIGYAILILVGLFV